ncbi:MAG: dihydrodipicolinate synthase family protein [Chloroflexi bacterium]|nr:dihydrodipicolinate synthase family protein [Chloroflexota bacterium]MBV9598871.1 dihydrodipicolinate synthase family protein [Chloroflexota bacterium]
MYSPDELHGVMAMMPAFATGNASDITAMDTIDVEHLKAGVERIIGDGIDVLATSGSYGEFHTLLWEEYVTLTHATVEAVKHRVPLFIGCTALNSREVVRRMRVAREAGAEGVLVGVPFYFPSTVDNAIRFYRDIANLFPELAIMIYHNPDLHNVTLPPGAFRELAAIPQVVGMKDSHRDTRGFIRLMQQTRGRVSVFVNAGQIYPFGELGATGFWSHEVWMGPWPELALRDAIARGDTQAALRIMLDLGEQPLASGEGLAVRQWLETASKLASGYGDYAQPGPLRPPFVVIPPEVDQRVRKRAAYRQQLNERYRPEVEAARKREAAQPVLA